jgi:hypothetical protein
MLAITWTSVFMLFLRLTVVPLHLSSIIDFTYLNSDTEFYVFLRASIYDSNTKEGAQVNVFSFRLGFGILIGLKQTK